MDKCLQFHKSYYIIKKIGGLYEKENDFYTINNCNS